MRRWSRSMPPLTSPIRTSVPMNCCGSISPCSSMAQDEPRLAELVEQRFFAGLSISRHRAHAIGERAHAEPRLAASESAVARRAVSGSLSIAVDRRRLIELFEQAIELPPDERARLLDEQCADDAPLRMEVERLLRADQQSSRFLETPPAIVASTRDAIACRRIRPAAFRRMAHVAADRRRRRRRSVAGRTRRRVRSTRGDQAIDPSHARIETTLSSGTADSGAPAASEYRAAHRWRRRQRRRAVLRDGIYRRNAHRRFHPRPRTRRARAAATFHSRLRGGAVRASESRRASRSQTVEHPCRSATEIRSCSISASRNCWKRPKVPRRRRRSGEC